jgi:hypothetical protein
LSHNVDGLVSLIAAIGGGNGSFEISRKYVKGIVTHRSQINNVEVVFISILNIGKVEDSSSLLFLIDNEVNAFANIGKIAALLFL